MAKKKEGGEDKQKILLFAIIGLFIGLAVIQIVYLQMSQAPGERLTLRGRLEKVLGLATATTSATVTNSVPVASSAELDGGSAITLGTNVSFLINGTVTITDNNGCDDIEYVNGTLFESNHTITDALDNRTLYRVACVSHGDCTGGADTAETWNCSFTVTHFANPTDAGSNHSDNIWNFTVAPFDEATGTTDSQNQEINTNTAFEVTSALAFGTLTMSSDSGAVNTNATVYNVGNEGMDMQLDAYGTVNGDGLAMNCTVGNISVEYIQYSNVQFTWNASSNVLVNGTNMTDTAAELDIDATFGSDGDTIPTKQINFGLGIPANVGGTCGGIVTFTAVSDPHND